MEFEILGSGGAITVPRPGFHDRLNDEARARGVPYQRRGPSVFLHGPDVLFDTPEDIAESLNRAGVDQVRACFYSHWHPDHTMGRRVFETLNYDYRSEQGAMRRTDVFVTEVVRDTMIKTLATWEHLSYLEGLGVVKLHVVAEGEAVEIDGYRFTAQALAEAHVFGWHVEHMGKRAFVAMDELVGCRPDERVMGLDLAILPSGVCEFHPVSGERRLAEGHRLLSQEMRFERTLDVVREMGPQHAVLMHLDEPDGISYDDGREMSRRYRAEGLPITIGWDGLRVRVE